MSSIARTLGKYLLIGNTSLPFYRTYSWLEKPRKGTEEGAIISTEESEGFLGRHLTQTWGVGEELPEDVNSKGS